MTIDEETDKMAQEIANLINTNIKQVTSVITNNIHNEKPHTIIAGFAALHTVSVYYEYKLNKMGIPPKAIEKAKSSAENYALDVIADEMGTVAQEKGEA